MVRGRCRDISDERIHIVNYMPIFYYNINMFFNYNEKRSFYKEKTASVIH